MQNNIFFKELRWRKNTNFFWSKGLKNTGGPRPWLFLNTTETFSWESSLSCTWAGTNNAPFLLQCLWLHNHNHVILHHDSITLYDSLGEMFKLHYKWSHPYYYLPITLKRAILLLDPVHKYYGDHRNMATISQYSFHPHISCSKLFYLLTL